MSEEINNTNKFGEKINSIWMVKLGNMYKTKDQRKLYLDDLSKMVFTKCRMRSKENVK